jgi:BirA family biotin operon repressor/biotin-[acetyl-CoA-carboxylase] ligase
LKWPNDILIEPRKVGGLLCESSGAGTAHGFVIVGIGLNVNMWRDMFPPDLRDVATSLAAEAGRPFDRAALLATVLSELELRYDAFLSGATSELRREYALRCATIGQRVRVDMANGTSREGLARGVDEDGSLQVLVEPLQGQSTRDSVVAIRAGDVVHLRRHVNR